MNFEEALANLKIGKILTRKSWTDIRIHASNNEIIFFKTGKKWEPKQEDIFADDWASVDPDDIKEFHLSVNEIRALGVNEEEISKLKDKTYGKKVDYSGLLTPEAKEKIKALIENPPPLVFNVPQMKIPEFNK